MDSKIQKEDKKARQNQSHDSALYSKEVNMPHDLHYIESKFLRHRSWETQTHNPWWQLEHLATAELAKDIVWAQIQGSIENKLFVDKIVSFQLALPSPHHTKKN